MEFQKFLQRPIKFDKPITSFRMNRTLCQDTLFTLAHNKRVVKSFIFTKAFFYDFFDNTTNISFDSLYVLDGVEYLHKRSKSTKPLVRDRALYSFLYLDGDATSAFASAVITNPWLNELSNRRLRYMSERASAIKSEIYRIGSVDIIGAIKEHLDSGFTPRGVWGLDYIFRWKHNTEPALQVNDDIRLIPLAEYIELFKED